MRWAHYVSGMLGCSVGINQSHFHNDPDPVRQVLGSAPFTDEWVWQVSPKELLVQTRVRAKRGALTWGFSASATTDVWGWATSCCRAWHMHCSTVRASVTPPGYLLAASIPWVWPSELSPDTVQCPQEDKITHSWEPPCCVWPLSRVWLFATPRTAACQASLSIINFWSLLKPMYIESVMPSKHLIPCTSAGLSHRSLLSTTWLCSGPVSAPVAPRPTPSLTGSSASTWRGKSHQQLTCNFDRSRVFVTHEL